VTDRQTDTAVAIALYHSVALHVTKAISKPNAKLQEKSHSYVSDLLIIGDKFRNECRQNYMYIDNNHSVGGLSCLSVCLSVCLCCDGRDVSTV